MNLSWQMLYWSNLDKDWFPSTTLMLSLTWRNLTSSLPSSWCTEMTCQLHGQIFSSAPIKGIVAHFPMLRRCLGENCFCDAWHNVEGFPIREPSWTFGAGSSLKAISIRPRPMMLNSLLFAFGSHRLFWQSFLSAADPKDFMLRPVQLMEKKSSWIMYVVIWTPKLSTTEVMHLKQTDTSGDWPCQSGRSGKASVFWLPMPRKSISLSAGHHVSPARHSS